VTTIPLTASVITAIQIPFTELVMLFVKIWFALIAATLFITIVVGIPILTVLMVTGAIEARSILHH